MTKKKDNVITLDENGVKNLKTFADHLAKKNAETEDRPYRINSAALKDGCNYSYEILSGVGEGDVVNVKGKGVATDDLIDAFRMFNAHLAKLEYFSFDVVDRSMLRVNSSGTDFTEASLRAYYRQINMPAITVGYANRLLARRKNLLVFCSLIEEANKVAQGVPGAVVITGDTDPRERERILLQFKSGRIRCVINVGVLTTGFDYPELEAVLIARSTMSLALYYQIVGRVMRPHDNKVSAWVVDLGGNVKFFGKIETMQIRTDHRGLFSIWQGNRQLTNVPFEKAA